MAAINYIWFFLKSHASEIIAICALLFTAYQSWSTRKHNRLSVKPNIITHPHRQKDKLNIPTGNTISTGRIWIELLNHGLGPAVIQEYKILLDNNDTGIKNINDAEFELTKLLDNKIVTHKSVEILSKGYHVAAKEKKVILDISFPINATQNLEDFLKIQKRISLIVTYKSLYGKSFIYDSRVGNI